MKVKAKIKTYALIAADSPEGAPGYLQDAAGRLFVAHTEEALAGYLVGFEETRKVVQISEAEIILTIEDEELRRALSR